MSESRLYLIAVLIPLIVMPIVLPMVVLMARRKRLTDNPSRRKTQEHPVAVMGGTVVLLVLTVSLLIINIFYDITVLFPVLCMMVVFYVFGMLDDNIGLSWKFKLALQIVAILLLFVGSNYGIHSLYSLYPDQQFSLVISLALTLFVGLLLLNAVNFVDGIDGLASGLGILVAAFTGYWYYLHGFMANTLLSMAMLGVLIAFFVYNVFSSRCKTYLGDSGSLALGLFVYVSVCPVYGGIMTPDLMVDHYYVSFVVALISEMCGDLLRVSLWRVVNHQSPFRPDRSHLHHIFVDIGMSHFMATTVLILMNFVALAFWYLTARLGLSQKIQLGMVVLFCIILYWSPYFYICYIRDHKNHRYRKLLVRVHRINKGFVAVHNVINRLIDGHHTSIVTHEIE